MRIPLDRENDTPLYRQIEAFLRQGILSGSFAPHSRLPAIRTLARTIGVNRITVENAYAELEAEGLVVCRVGSGTYVLSTPQPPPAPESEPVSEWPLWQRDLFASNEDRLPRSMSTLPTEPANGREPEKPGAERPSMITFAGGAGDPHLFQVSPLRKAIQSVIKDDDAASLMYGDPRGNLSLRSTIVQLLGSQGLRARVDNLLITSGSQQALALITQMLLKPGDPVLVEIPTYSIVLKMLRAKKYTVIGIPVDDGGMEVHRLEKLLQQHHPKLIYTVPTFHNPTGTCLSSQRRSQLITLADRYNVPILEDDFVGDLRYEGHVEPTLKALDPGGRVILVSTFSKMLIPGLRVGFIVAEGPIYDLLVEEKKLNDLGTSSLIQRALNTYVTVGRYQAHILRTTDVYRKRRDAMLRAIQRYLPAGVWSKRPIGGLFIWLHLPPDLSSDALLPFALKEGVAFSPGSNYFLDPEDGNSYLRLNFAAHHPETIEEGIRRLGCAIRKLQDS